MFTADDPYSPPDSTQREAEVAVRRRRRQLLVIFAACGGALTIFALFVAVMLSSQSYPVRAEDREVLVTVEDLGAWLADLESVPSGETVHKKRYFDGTWELTYEYDHPAADVGLYASCGVTIGNSRSDAATTYWSMKVGLGLGLQMAEGIEIRQLERNDLFRWGDQSYHALLMRGEDPIGNALVARKGKQVYMLVTAGLYFDTAASLEELLGPKLGALHTYRPRR